MKITFLYHSAVMIETDQAILIFDAYQVPLPQKNSQLPVYLFYSHAHHDHYHPDILNELKENMTLIVSDDIKLPANLKHKYISVHPHQIIHCDDLTVETLDSNDEGVAFMVQCDKLSIYHSGDLNDWHWQDEEDEILEAKYRTELKRIAGRHFNLACIPLDPRLEDYMMGGIEIFTSYASADYILPIHSWKKYEGIDTLIQKRPDLHILPVKKENTVFDIEVST